MSTSWMRDHYVFLALDYSQIEIRMLAECANDELLIEQFKSGQDIHCIVGNTLTGMSVEQIKNDKPTRTFIKNCHFGMVYGLDGEGLFYYCKAKGIQTTVAKTTKFRKKYFATYKGVAKFIVTCQAFVRENGFIDNIFDFRRKIGKDWDEDRKTNPENQAVNSPIQGSAHMLLLTALGLLSTQVKRYDLLQACVAEIHDALLFRVRLDKLAEAFTQAKYLLEEGVPAEIYRRYGRKLGVPLLAEAKAGFRYGTICDYNGGEVRSFLSEWKTYNEKVEKGISEKYNQTHKVA